MERLVETKKGSEKEKRLHRRRTFHGRTQQTKTPQRSLSGITDTGGILTKTPINRSCSVRKPLQVVSATKASSNSSFFSGTKKDRNISVTKFATKMMEPVVKSKTPVVFTKPKPQVLSSTLPHPQPDSAEGSNSDSCQFPQSLVRSSDDVESGFNDGEKPFVLQSLLSSRKSKKLDFIIKDSKNTKSGIVKANQDKTASASSSTNQSASSVVTESSSMITKSSLSCTSQSCTTSKRMRVDEKLNMETALDLPFISSKVDEDTTCKQSSINQETLHSVHGEANEDDEFSKSVFSGTSVKRDSKAFNKHVDSSLPRDPRPPVCSSEMQCKNEEKPERKKLKVSRKSAKPSSRKALQEARIQGLKNDFKNSNQEFEIGQNVSQTPSLSDAVEILPSSMPETDIFCIQKSTPSPTGNIDKPCESISETQTPPLSSSSTSSCASLESSTKTYKDWMHLFEEPFPRRSPRLSSHPSSTAKDYENLMDNFSPLTSRMRSKGRKKQSKERSNEEKTTKEKYANNGSVTLKDLEVKSPVSPLVLAEKQTSRTSASENNERKKGKSTKRPKTGKTDKKILSKKTKSNVSVNQTFDSDSLIPSSSTGLDVPEDDSFHFPKPPAVLSCPGGPYSLVVDFALPDKDYAKLKLAKIKGNQARKKATQDYKGTPSYQDLKGKQILSENLVTDKGKGNESVEVDKDSDVNDNKLANLAAKGVDPNLNIKVSSGIKDEREITVIPRVVSDKNESQGQDKDTLIQLEVEDENSFIPATPKTKTDRSITNDCKTSNKLSEERFSEYSDSENTLSESILQNLQVQNNVDNDRKPETTQNMNDLDSSKKYFNKTVGHAPKSSESSVENISPEILKMSSHKEENLCLRKHLKDLETSSQNRGKSHASVEYENSLEYEMKGNRQGIKHEKLPPGKECVPSSQGSSVSQSPNDLKCLLLLNGGVEKKSHPNSVSNHLFSLEKQQQGQQAGSDTLDDSENSSISSKNPPGTILLQSKSTVKVVQDSIDKDAQKIGEDFPLKHKETILVFGGLEVAKICSHEERVLSQEKSNLACVNEVTDHLSNNNSKTTQLLQSENDIKMVSVVNQISVSQLDKTLSFSHDDTQMDSLVNQVVENQCGLANIPSSFSHDTGMGSIVNQESRNLVCVETPDRNILHGVTGQLHVCSNTEEFDNTPESIKGSMLLYSNPEECNDQPTVPDASLPLCPETEKFSQTQDTPLRNNTEEFCIAESESLEPSIGDTATPHGKASVPQSSSVMDTESCHTENSILTPVLMQACLQHDNSDSDKVLSISMSTYDIPGHVVKKRDVIAVCLSHWVVLWIKMGGQEWTVLKSWTLVNTDSEMFHMVKFLSVSSHLALFVGGTFPSSNGRIYGYSDTTSYDFQLEYENVNDLMWFSSMCVLNDKEQCAKSTDSGVELVVAGATESGPLVTKWSLDCHCLDVMKHQELTLPYGNGAVTSLCTVDGNSYLLVGSTGTHLLLWNSKHCDLLKEINLSNPGLHNFDCLHVATEMGLLFLIMCQRSAAQKEFESNGSPCHLYALNPLNNNFKCLKSFSFQHLATSSPRCSSVCGQYLALGYQDGEACLVNMAASQHSAIFPVFQGAVHSISFHPSRPIIAFGGGKKSCVHVYSLS